jgi:F420-dependent oxidoreductase-like protein
MRIDLMIEGQEDVSWNQWATLARACEDYGIESLFRSDHYASVEGVESRGSLDAWTTLAGLAARTTRLRLGTLVSPTTFRHPSVLAKSVVTVDHISTGRAELGIGAGWFEDEHVHYGFNFPPTAERMQILAEQMEIVHRSWTEDSFSFSGHHYSLEVNRSLPKPLQQPHPPLILGGSGGRRSADLAARWADEYNTVFASAGECRRRRKKIAAACERAGRDPSTLAFSVMTGIVVGARESDVLERARQIMAKTGEGGDPKAWLGHVGKDWVVGTIQQVITRLGELAEAGVDRVMLQHLLHEDIETVEILGREVSMQLSRRPSSHLLRPKEPFDQA